LPAAVQTHTAILFPRIRKYKPCLQDILDKTRMIVK
jgi:hypothetical protein